MEILANRARRCPCVLHRLELRTHVCQRDWRILHCRVALFARVTTGVAVVASSPDHAYLRRGGHFVGKQYLSQILDEVTAIDLRAHR